MHRVLSVMCTVNKEGVCDLIRSYPFLLLLELAVSNPDRLCRVRIELRQAACILVLLVLFLVLHIFLSKIKVVQVDESLCVL